MKLLTEFGKRAAGRNGLDAWCKPCRAEYRRGWRVAHREQLSADNAEWRRLNPEKAAANVAGWVRKNPARKAAQNTARCHRKLAAPGRGVTTAEWLAILAAADGHCTYCHEPAKLTMDHIVPLILGGAHDVTNIAAVCGPCNSSKGARPLDVFLLELAA